MAVRCKKMIVTLYDESDREVNLPLHAAGGQKRETDSAISLENVWFGMRTGVLVNGSVELGELIIVLGQPVRGNEQKSPLDEQPGFPKRRKPEQYVLKEKKPLKGFITLTSDQR